MTRSGRHQLLTPQLGGLVLCAVKLLCNNKKSPATTCNSDEAETKVASGGRAMVKPEYTTEELYSLSNPYFDTLDVSK